MPDALCQTPFSVMYGLPLPWLNAPDHDTFATHYMLEQDWMSEKNQAMCL